MSEFWLRLILMTQERLGKDMDCTLDLYCAKLKETCSFKIIVFVTKSFHENRDQISPKVCSRVSGTHFWAEQKKPIYTVSTNALEPLGKCKHVRFPLVTGVVAALT